MNTPSEETGADSAQFQQLRSSMAHRAGKMIGTAQCLTLAIPRLSLHRYAAPTALTDATYGPSIALVLQGSKRVDLGSRSFLYDESNFLLTSLDLPVASQVTVASADVPYLCLRLQIDIAMVRDVLGVGDIALTDAHAADVGMTTAVTTDAMLGAFSRLLDVAEKPGEIAFLGGLIEREIVFRILQSAEGQRLRSIATLGSQGHKTAVAIAWIRDNYTQPLRLEELAKIACMGLSALHHHFRALTSMTPLQYQKKLRLQRARRRMLIDGVDAASAAFEVGYESASQFSREYCRFFGQPPMRDVQALRGAVGPTAMNDAATVSK